MARCTGCSPTRRRSRSHASAARCSTASSLEGVRLRTTRDELDIDSLALDWNAAALLAGTLAFDDADAARATYRRLPGAASSGGGPPELPWPVRLEQASVATLSVTIARAHAAARRRRASPRPTAAAGSSSSSVTTTWATPRSPRTRRSSCGAGIDFDVAGEWSAPLAGVASTGTRDVDGHVAAAARSPRARDTVRRNDGRARSSFDGPFNVDLVTEWHALAWPGVDDSHERQRPARVDAARSTTYRYDGAGVLDVLGRDADFTAEGTGERLELAIARLELATPTRRRAAARCAAPAP